MPQFYLPGPWEIQKPTTLTPEVAHHLRVRRVQAGESFPVFDGKGQVAQAELLSLTAKSGEALLTQARLDTHRETPYAITLAQGLAGGDKMDWIVEKAIETGAQNIAPLQCERSVIKLTGPNNAERAQKRLLHWKGIIQAACEQCDRTVLANLEPIQSFESFLKASQKPSIKATLKSRCHQKHAFSADGDSASRYCLNDWSRRWSLPKGGGACPSGRLSARIFG